MATNNNIIRIPFSLYRNNEEHQRVYEILQKQENKNAFIRQAILSYGKILERDNKFLIEEIQKIVQAENREMYLQLLSLLTDKQENDDAVEDNSDSYGEKTKEIDFSNLKNLF